MVFWLEAQDLVTPLDPTLPHPKMRLAARLAPNRWGKIGPTLGVRADVPAWLCFDDNQEFDDIAAAAGAAHTDAPILAIIAR
jgi:hypothetical protein